MNLNPIPKGAKEFYLNLPHLTIEGLIWGADNPKDKTILALHGWLDNAMTFANIAPMFTKAGWRFIALEMPGHGKSSWLPRGFNYNLFDVTGIMLLALQSLSQNKLTLLAHSLGGIVFSFLTSAKNNLVDKLILIDSMGTLPNKVDTSAAQLNKYLDKWQKNLFSNSSKLVIYPTIEEAAKARTQGFLPITYDASLQICQRGLKPTKGGFCWNSDPRLLIPLAVNITEEQNLAFFSNISVPVLEIAADNGMILTNPKMSKRMEVIPNLTLKEIHGNHHLHLEESSFEEVGQTALDFLMH